MADARQGLPPSPPNDDGQPASADELTFRALLRRHRLAAGLSQEALAELAGLSMAAVSALERGERQAPYRHTVGALVTALGLTGPERAAFEAVVTRSRRHPAATQPAPQAPRAPLPLVPAPLVDRSVELETALALLGGDTARLLTLTGPGGVGKTRLALEVARESQAAFGDGVWFVDLSAIRDPGLVLPTMAQALGLPERGTRSPLGMLQAHLQEQHTLLVLDNFEQVLAAAPQLAELLAACPRLKLLVTSRARLRLRWEHNLPVPPLAFHDPQAPLTAEGLAAVPAVALFVERAQASSATFALTTANGPAVATLCRHLEGLPLALELAAARANVLAPSQMLPWAEHRLPVLAWDAPDLPTRQRSLRATLAWSYALLPAAEQALFRRLAVFVDGWTPEAAEAVTGTQELGLDPLEGLARLTDASLIQVRPADDHEQRFGLLETVREFAAEQLADSGENPLLERQHAAYYLALAERAAARLRSPEQGVWSRRLQREHANMRAALGWAAQQGEAECELRLASSLVDFWWQHGYWREGQAWLEDALARSPDHRDGSRQQALRGLGLLTAYLGDYAVGAARLEEALTLARELGEEQRFALTLGWLGVVAYLHGQIDRWPALAAELEAARPRADPRKLSFALTGLGLLAQEAGEHSTARRYLEEALAARREDNSSAVATVLGGLVLVAQAQGDQARAVSLLMEGLQLVQEVAYPRVLARYAHIALGVTAAWAPAAALARLLGAADAQRARALFPLSPRHQAEYEQLVAAVRTAIGEEAFAAGWAAGRSLSADELVEEVLSLLATCPGEQ